MVCSRQWDHAAKTLMGIQQAQGTCSLAAVTNSYHLATLKQGTFILSWFCRPKGQIKVSGGLCCL